MVLSGMVCPKPAASQGVVQVPENYSFSGPGFGITQLLYPILKRVQQRIHFLWNLRRHDLSHKLSSSSMSCAPASVCRLEYRNQLWNILIQKMFNTNVTVAPRLNYTLWSISTAAVTENEVQVLVFDYIYSHRDMTSTVLHSTTR